MFGSMQMRALCAMIGLLPIVAEAHVTVWPRESTVGATEKYTIQVPTEGKVTTTAAELEVPDGVTIEALAVPQGPNGIRATAVTKLNPRKTQ